MKTPNPAVVLYLAVLRTGPRSAYAVTEFLNQKGISTKVSGGSYLRTFRWLAETGLIGRSGKEEWCITDAGRAWLQPVIDVLAILPAPEKKVVLRPAENDGLEEEDDEEETDDEEDADEEDPPFDPKNPYGLKPGEILLPSVEPEPTLTIPTELPTPDITELLASIDDPADEG